MFFTYVEFNLVEYTLDELNSPPYVIITEEEYDALKNNCKT